MSNKIKSFIYDGFEYKASFVSNKRSEYSKRFVSKHDKGDWEQISEKDYNFNLKMKSLLT